jgi:hypothetical protein
LAVAFAADRRQIGMVVAGDAMGSVALPSPSADLRYRRTRRSCPRVDQEVLMKTALLNDPGTPGLGGPKSAWGGEGKIWGPLVCLILSTRVGMSLSIVALENQAAKLYALESLLHTLLGVRNREHSHPVR